MTNTNDTWDIEHLREHLQAAVNLEYWTIPYYMAAMYSIKDPASDAYKLIQSVVYQEMLHVQLACNVANAFGATIDKHVFDKPKYHGKQVPHLKMFSEREVERDPFDPTQSYNPYSAEIGPLDERRINTMCLIEYPYDPAEHPPHLQQDMSKYATIGEFYEAVLFGATQHVSEIRKDCNQVEIFKNFYRDFPSQTVTYTGVAGLGQVINIIRAITDQGEGVCRMDTIPPEYRNTADGFNSDEDHFAKLNQIKNLTVMPETYTGAASPSGAGADAQEILRKSFKLFRHDLIALFTCGKHEDFGPHMATLGGNILNCWRNGAIPKFSANQ